MKSIFQEFKNVNILFLTAVILVGLYLCYHSIRLWYLYNYTEINFFAMSTNLELLLDVILGSVLILNGLLGLMKKAVSLLLFTLIAGASILSAILFMINSDYFYEELIQKSYLIVIGVCLIFYSTNDSVKRYYNAPVD